MHDVELRDALARHAQLLDERAPAITAAELDRSPTPIARRAPRRMLVRIAIALTVVVALVAAVAVLRGAPDANAPARPAGPDAKQVSRYRWTEISAPADTGLFKSAIAWTGHELLVWGGETGGITSTLRADGTAFDPRTGSWRALAPAPLAARLGSASVWTGRTFFVWGGGRDGRAAPFADGARYDPVRDRWSSVPASPLPARVDAQAIWTGREVLVVGGFSADGTTDQPVLSLADTAAYNPARDSWRRLAPIPTRAAHPVLDTVALWIGDRLLVWRLWARFGAGRPALAPDASGIDMFTYSPRADRWRAIPNRKNMARGVTDPVWTGREVIVPPTATWCECVGPQGTEDGFRYDPRTNRWRQIAAAPIEGVAGPAVWTGRALLFVNSTTSAPPDTVPGDGAAYDPRQNRWYRLARPPRPLAGGQQTLVWTSRELLVPSDLEIVNENGIGVGTRSSGGLRLGP
jgi:hypothetical protein